MKVEKSKDSQEVRFESVAQGDTFMWGGEHYIKTEDDQDDQGQATCLEDGMVLQFSEGDEVVPVNAKVVILEG